MLGVAGTSINTDGPKELSAALFGQVSSFYDGVFNSGV